MNYDNKFISALSQVVKQLTTAETKNIKEIEKEVIEKLVEKGYQLNEISDILEEIFKITKTQKKKDIKLRVIHPSEVANLTDDAKNYLFLVKDIIEEKQFEELLNSFTASQMRIDINELKQILEKKEIISNHLLN